MGVSAVTLLGLAAEPESASAEACRRLADWLKPHQAKELARWFEASPRTAEGWRRGQWPCSRHEHRMVRRWGRAWLDYVYGPLLPPADRDLSAQLAEIEGRLAAVRAGIEEVERHGAVAGDRAGSAGTGAAAGAAAQRGGRALAGAGAGLGGLGARLGALALALAVTAGVVLAAEPAQARALRASRAGGRVMRVLRHGETGGEIG